MISGVLTGCGGSGTKASVPAANDAHWSDYLPRQAGTGCTWQADQRVGTQTFHARRDDRVTRRTSAGAGLRLTVTGRVQTALGSAPLRTSGSRRVTYLAAADGTLSVAMVSRGPGVVRKASTEVYPSIADLAAGHTRTTPTVDTTSGTQSARFSIAVTAKAAPAAPAVIKRFGDVVGVRVERRLTDATASTAEKAAVASSSGSYYFARGVGLVLELPDQLAAHPEQAYHATSCPR